MKKPVLIAVAVVVVVVVAGWIAANPVRRFGLSTQALTTYDRVPFPYVDLQVRSDGESRTVRKLHRIQTEQLMWLTTPEPEVLIIAGGWQGDARAIEPVGPLPRTKVLTLPTGKALELFNSLREQGVRVAIHVHSSC